MSMANEFQVGGDHYRTNDGKPQHWDLAVMYGWDPFQYQITKYVMRWKTKHPTPAKRLEDLKKARHFIDKYIEEWERYDSGKGQEPHTVLGAPPAPVEAVVSAPGGPFTLQPAVGSTVTGQRTLAQYEASHPSYLHDQTFLCEGGYGNGFNLYTHRQTKQLIVARSLDEAHARWSGCNEYVGVCYSCGRQDFAEKRLEDAGDQPASGYVNQG